MAVAGRGRALAVMGALLVAACGSAGPTRSLSPTAAALVSPARTAPPSAEAAASETLAWVIEPGSASAAPAELVAAIGALPVRPSTGSAFDLRAITVQGDWAVASGGVQRSRGSPVAPTETVVMLAHLAGTSWQVVTDRDPTTFCPLLAAAPVDLLGATARAFFVGCR